MNMVEKLKKIITQEKLFLPHENILVAVSGGADSVALARCLSQLKYKISLAHVNYHLRGDESNGDELFVKELAQSLKVPFYVKSVEIPKTACIQEKAREIRYSWFNKLSEQKKFHKIATAHHANDQIETVIMRMFLRGSSILSLRGIPLKNGKIVRPFLSFTKQEILDWIHLHEFAYREDSSNLSLDYDRNIVRNNFIPLLEKHFPQFEKNLLNNINIWKEGSLMQSHYLEQKIRKHIQEKEGEIFFPIRYLETCGFSKTILWHYAEPKNFTSAQIDELIKLYNSKNGSFVKSVSHRFIKQDNWLILTNLISDDKSKLVFIEQEGEFKFGHRKFCIKKVETIPPVFEKENHLEEWICLHKIDFPLTLRPWKTGDYFYPLGMKKKKKISRFLIDTKTPLLEKENTWLLTTEKKVIAILGKRIDDRFKVTSQSKEVYQLKLSD